MYYSNGYISIWEIMITTNDMIVEYEHDCATYVHAVIEYWVLFTIFSSVLFETVNN